MCASRHDTKKARRTGGFAALCTGEMLDTQGPSDRLASWEKAHDYKRLRVLRLFSSARYGLGLTSLVPTSRRDLLCGHGALRMGVEAARPSSSRGAPTALSGLFTRAWFFSSGGYLGSSGCNSAGTARLHAHWNRPMTSQSRLPIEHGMHLALMLCREALHPRVELFSEEAA